MLNTSTTVIKLYSFLKDYGNSRTKRELMLFFGLHPNAKFDIDIVRTVLDGSKLGVESALMEMVNEGLLDNHISDTITLYSLTTDESRRKPIIALANLGRHGLSLLLRYKEFDNQRN